MGDTTNVGVLVADLEKAIDVWLTKVCALHSTTILSTDERAGTCAPLPTSAQTLHSLTRTRIQELMLFHSIMRYFCVANADHEHEHERCQVPEGGQAHAAAQAAAEEACAALDAAIAQRELAKERRVDDSASVAREIEELQRALARKDQLVADQRRLLERWRDRLAQLRAATPGEPLQ